MITRVLLLTTALLIACCEDGERLNTPVTPQPSAGSLRFDDSPSCPAPYTPRADSYVDHGGASNALSWYLLMRALDGPSYRETHVVHHYAPRPVYVTRPAPSGRGWVASSPASTYARPTPVSYTRPIAPKPAPVVVKPASGWTQRTTTTGARMAPSPAQSAPKSTGYGYSTKPSGASVRPSAPAPSRPSTPSFRSTPSSSSFRSSGSSFGGSRSTGRAGN